MWNLERKKCVTEMAGKVFTIFLIFVKTQRNSTQLKTTLKQLALELDTVVTCSTPPPPPTNFPASSRPARELKFGTDNH